MYRLFKSDFFNFEALRLLSFTAHEGGEIAEFFEALGKVKDLDRGSWYAAWTEAADKAEALALAAEQSQNRLAARRAFFRASNYQRAAQFMLQGGRAADPRILIDSENSISNFWRAVTLLDCTATRLQIPYDAGDGTAPMMLPAYLYLPHPTKRPASMGAKTPILINTVGGDATQEEIFYIFPMAALELGYAVLTFEGPGQGIVLRRHGVPFRPDWEAVVSPVLDYLVGYAAARPTLSLDVDRIALAGSSMGGYLSLRGATDARIKACVSSDPFYAMWDMLQGRMPQIVSDTFVAGGFVSDPLWGALASLLGWLDPQTRWESEQTCWMLGADGAADMLRRMQQYTLATADGKGVLSRVRCPVFVTGARHGLYCTPEVSTARIVEELVNVPEGAKECWIAEDAGEGGLQSKVGAFGVLNQKVFAFLDGVFGVAREMAVGSQD
ncbi:alpha/beta-hydrolase [Aspergillus heteromorphus CBS 117.55]|uniref:Alpha/beta-hydrolase n=1 Tax=Aspergillus heteromorphus CBS 117.55 TaxID=1448321 RepID=A0A317VCP7_9EURO|nr:alpha/beta-hydrolase [Aspergillus heteromorphus CBS 117.55]PWY71021.1 alpha/beta-hydrolase [Aspergillus heteromorphus CBS 117.55]